MKRAWVFALMVTLTPAWAGEVTPAWADDVDGRVEALAARAHADYLTGEYERAASLLLDAYRLRPVAKLLFNVAKAYDKGKMVGEAATHYRLFLTQAEPDDPLVPKAQEALAALPSQVPPAPIDPPPPQPTPTWPSGKGRAVAAVGLTVAAAIAGATFGWLALSKHQEFEDALALRERKQLRQDAQRRALVADISWSLSAAAAVAAMLLWPSGAEEQTESEGVDARLGVDPRGVAVVGRW